MHGHAEQRSLSGRRIRFMRMKEILAIGYLWLLLALCCAGTPALADSVLTGSPPYVRMVPEENADLQNFAVAQDSTGLVFVGNGSGVLEYDGELWTLITLDNREMVRSLAIADDDRVYVGGYNAMGYLQRDASGRARFVDLTAKFTPFIGQREFADIWDTLVTPEGVYFRALRDLFFWDPKTDRRLHWHHEQRFGTIAYFQSQTLVQFRDEGMRQRVGDEWVALPGTNHLRNLIYALVPLRDGGLLTAGVDGDWWRLQDGPPRPVDMPASLPPSSHFEHVLALTDGSLALASRDGSLYIVDPQRQGERHFKLDSGFLSGIHRTIDGGFVVAGDQAIYHITWPSAWSMLGAEQGAEGSLERLARWNEREYLISSSGISMIIPHAGSPPTLQAQPWGELLAHDLIEIDSSRALIAQSFKLLLLEDGRTQEISPELVYPRQFFASQWRAGRIYIGSENGLRFVDLVDGALRLSPLANNGLEMTVDGVVELSADELWFGTVRHGLWQVFFDQTGGIREQRRWGSQDGLTLGIIPSATVARQADGALIVATHAGLFTRSADRFVASDQNGLATLRQPEELLYLVLAEQADQWAYSNRRVLHRPAGGQWQEAPLRQLLRGSVLTHSLDSTGQMRFVASQSLLLHQAIKAPADAAAPRVLLRAVTRVRSDGTREPLALQRDQSPSLTAGDYTIQFQFALPDLTEGRGHQYQARLLGYEAFWSEWANTRAFGYSRLRPGNYQFQLRARDGARRISEIEAYPLQILAPWYARWWAWSLWMVLALAMIVVLVQLMIRRRVTTLAAQTQMLEGMIAQRTRDLATANAQLEAMAHLDGLTGISNRRRLDHYLNTLWTGDQPRQLSLLAIDVDHFKKYNDSHGHLAGDQMLKELVQRLARCLRSPDDLLARFGGEEFVVVLPGADLATAHGIAEKMRWAVETAELGSTISIGIASRRAGDGKLADLLHAADLALYTAKRNGRNRIALEALG